MRVALLVSVFLGAVAGCNPYDPDLGDVPFRCGTSAPTCPEGYVEEQRSMVGCVCVRAGAAGDGGVGQIDSGGGPTDCNDDSSFEPNDQYECPPGQAPAECDLLGSATPTAIGAAATTTNFNDMAICPGADKDHFRMNIPQAQTDILVAVTFEIGGGDLRVDILNSSGSSIATGSPVSSNRIEAMITASTPGTYYARVQSAQGDDNNYHVRLSITLP